MVNAPGSGQPGAVDRQIDDLLPAVLRLRATLLLGRTTGGPDCSALARVVRLESDLRAHADCEAELARLEERWTPAL